MKKLSLALLCGMVISGSAIAAGPNATKDNMSNPQVTSQQRPVPAEESVTPEWHAKQWDKAQWDKMTPAEKTDYKTKHQHVWNKMTPEEREAMRAKHKGAKNYMDDNWDKPTAVHNPQNVGGENKGTPK